MGSLINQEDNYAANFGSAFRSSAIFYKPRDIKATISFSNYWKFKNNVEVGLVASTRDMKGNIVSREDLEFKVGNVLNLEVNSIEEGSIEIEAFSSRNLRIPYAAIMVVYETENAVSMVHSYGRNHSLIELEDEKAITEARESCWTLRGKPNVTNHAIFHNGHVALKPQECVFIVTRNDGVERKLVIDMPLIEAFETFEFHAEEMFPELHEFLGGKIGWGTLHFESYSSFTRLLIIWKNSETKEVQVTHSNFDYSAHSTNSVESTKPAYMQLPNVYEQLPGVIVYPKFTTGNYLVNNVTQFSNGISFLSDIAEVTFSRTDGELPARIVTSIFGAESGEQTLPYECSLGVVHEKRPQKRFHWFLVSSILPTVIHITFFDKIYGTFEPIELIVKLYSDASLEVDEVVLSYDSLRDIPKELKVSDVFEMSGIKSFAYVSIFSHYGGFVFFSSLRKNRNITIEHSF